MRLGIQERRDLEPGRTDAIKPIDQPDAFEARQVFQAGDEWWKNLHRACAACGIGGLHRRAGGLPVRRVDDADWFQFHEWRRFITAVVRRRRPEEWLAGA